MEALGELGTIMLSAVVGIAMFKLAMAVFPLPILKDIAAFL